MSDEVKIDERWTLETRALVAAAVNGPGCDHPGAETCEPWWIADRVLGALADAGLLAALSVPSEPVPDGPRVWAAVPTFPDDVKAFRDAEGRVWRRDQTKPGWRRDTGAWTQKDPLELLRYHPRLSPLTEVVEEATP